MKLPTLFSFITECLVKAGLDVDTYRLSDNSSSGINIYKRKGDQKFLIELQFDGDGIKMKDVKVFKVIEKEVDQQRIL
jgi:hypothetical protein